MVPTNTDCLSEMLWADGIVKDPTPCSPSPKRMLKATTRLDADGKEQNFKPLVKDEDLDNHTMWAILESQDGHPDDKDITASFPLEEDQQPVEAGATPVHAEFEDENMGADVPTTPMEQHSPKVAPKLNSEDEDDLCMSCISCQYGLAND
jgi:hypothetical protein